MRLADSRVPHAGLLAGAAGLASAALLVYMSQRLFFFSDEWSFIGELPTAGTGYYLEPHNEHWSTLLKLIYRLLLGAVGMRSYMPFMAVLAAAHVAAGLCLFALIRRRAGDLLALLALLLFLFMGRGYENLLIAFQIGFVGATACGLGAMLLLDRPGAGPGRLALASGLLLAALMLQGGVGLIYIGAIGVELLADQERRRQLTALAVPVAAYAAWYLGYGHRGGGGGGGRGLLSPDSLRSLIDYVPTGIGAAVAGLAGLSANWAPWGVAGLAAVVVAGLVASRQVDTRALGAAAGLVGFFVLSGLVRAQLGAGEAASSRYIYVVAPFVAILVSEVAKQLELRPAWQVALAGLVLALTAHSGQVLFAQYRALAHVEASQKDELRALSAVRNAPALDRQAGVDPDGHIVISMEAYFRAVDEYGSPVPPLDPAGLSSLPPDAVNRAMARAFGTRIQATPVASVQGCSPIDRVAGFADVQVPGGGSLVYGQNGTAPVGVYLLYGGGRAAEPGQEVIPAGYYTRMGVPDAGLPQPWTVRIKTGPNLTGLICAQ